MHIEILCEDRSGSIVISQIIKKFLRENNYDYTFDIRAHRGKGKIPLLAEQAPPPMASTLLALLPAKIRAYAEVYQADQLVLIVILDADEDYFSSLYQEIESLVKKFGRKIPYVIGVCVEEMESWLLADKQAILSAYPHAREIVIDSYQQDSVCGTWEVLARALYGKQAERLIKIGYPSVGKYKLEWADQIAPYLNLKSNKSPSFRRFYKQLERVFRNHVNSDINYG